MKLDNARVLKWADLASAAPTGQTRHVVKGVEVSDFAALAMATYDDDGGVYVFYCDPRWRVITDTLHETAEAAEAQAEFEFGVISWKAV